MNIVKKNPKIKPKLDNSLELKNFSKKNTGSKIDKYKEKLKKEPEVYEDDEMKGFSYVTNSLISLKDNILKDKDE